MADFDTGFWDSLFTALKSAWSDDLTGNSVILRVSQANHLNWNNVADKLSQFRDFEPPYVLVQIGTRVPEEWGLTNVTYRYPVWVYFITNAATDLTGAKVIEHAVSLKLGMLRDHLIRGAFAGFQLIEEPSIDTSWDNPANEVFNHQQSGFYAGLLMANLLTGETLN